MSSNFNTKTIECDSAEIQDKMYELETEWLTAILVKSGVSKIIVKKALNDPEYSASMWRNFLFDERGITIVKELQSKNVGVFQISETGQKVKIAEWIKPAISRKKGDRSSCVLELKYWQII
jgi:hypothetical protein